MTKTCTILIGPPGVGKSTWLEANWGKTINGRIGSSDTIIDTVAKMYGYSYNDMFSELIKFADKVFWDRIDIWASTGSDMILDRTNLSVKSRARYFERLRKHGYTFHAIVFPPPGKTEWDRRLDRPGKTIPQHVINNMLSSFDMPTEAEGFTSITIVNP